MRTIQAVSGIIAIVCMILLQILGAENWREDLFSMTIICLPVFLYASHVIGMRNQDEKGHFELRSDVTRRSQVVIQLKLIQLKIVISWTLCFSEAEKGLDPKQK